MLEPLDPRSPRRWPGAQLATKGGKPRPESVGEARQAGSLADSAVDGSDGRLTRSKNRQTSGRQAGRHSADAQHPNTQRDPAREEAEADAVGGGCSGRCQHARAEEQRQTTMRNRPGRSLLAAHYSPPTTLERSDEYNPAFDGGHSPILDLLLLVHGQEPDLLPMSPGRTLRALPSDDPAP